MKVKYQNKKKHQATPKGAVWCFFLILFHILIFSSLQAQSIEMADSYIETDPSKALSLAQKIEKNAVHDSIRADALSIQGKALLQIKNPKMFAQAIEKHQKALALRRQVFGYYSLYANYSLINLGNAYCDNLKQDSMAVVYYRQAIDGFEKIIKDKNNPQNQLITDYDTYHIGNTQRIVSDIALIDGDFLLAQEMAEKATKLLDTEGGEWLFAARMALGRSLFYNERTEEAFSVLKQAEAMPNLTDVNKSVLYAAIADCFDVENTTLTNKNQARIFYEKAFALSSQMAEQSERSKYLNKIGSYYLTVNQPIKALTYFQKAISILSKDTTSVLYGVYLTQMGNAYQQMKKYEQAHQKYDEALTKLTAFPIEKLIVLTQLAKMNFNIASQNGHWQVAAQAYQKAIHHLESYEEQISNPKSALILRGYFHALFGGISEVYIRLGQAETAFIWAERGKAFLLKKQKLSQGITSKKAIQDQLQDHKRLLFYSFGQQSLTIFVITKTQFYPLSIDTNGITQAVKKLFENIRIKSQVDEKPFFQEAVWLYQRLVAPTNLQANEDLVIIPDGILFYLPYEVLLTETPIAPTRFNKYPYLITKHHIRYLYSATTEVLNHENTPNLKNQILAFAPITDKKQLDLEPLQYNQREVDLIGKVWSSEILRGSDATKRVFKIQSPYHRLIHISTHGILNGDYPERSFLAFSPNSSDDGIFKMSEMDSVKLNADLVVLSACETADGRYYGGEGLMSIAHAFLASGAKSIVASMWQVNDSLTTNLMAAFYENLKNGESIESALQKAKLAFAAGENAHTAHPYYWAAFVFSAKSMATIDIQQDGFSVQKWCFLIFIFAVFFYFCNRWVRNLKKD